MDAQKTIDSLLNWLQQAVPQGSDLLVPVSGGSDSALVFWLCNQQFKAQTKGICIGHTIREQEWFASIGFVQFDDMTYNDNNPEVQRWAHFLGLALQENRIIVGSRNATETQLGTFSNASRVASFLPLAGLWKTEVMELCAYVGVPEQILASSKQADPECGRPQSLAHIPFSAVDNFLQNKLAGTSSFSQEPSPEQAEYLEELYIRSSYKAALPISGPAANRS